MNHVADAILVNHSIHCPGCNSKIAALRDAAAEIKCRHCGIIVRLDLQILKARLLEQLIQAVTAL